MLTQSQQNVIFTNIQDVYTVDGTVYTVTKIYRDHWSGVVQKPTILLNYVSRSKIETECIGRAAEYDSDLLSIDVLATTDHTNGIHGLEIVEFIMSEIEKWFKESFDADLSDHCLSASIYAPIEDLSFLEEKIYRLHVKYKIFYKLI